MASPNFKAGYLTSMSLSTRLGVLISMIVLFSSTAPAIITLILSLQKVEQIEAEKSTQILESLDVRLQGMRNYIIHLPDAIMDRYPLDALISDSQRPLTPGDDGNSSELPNFNTLMRQQFFPVRFLDEVSILSAELGGQEVFKAKWVDGVPTHIETSTLNVTANIPFFIKALRRRGAIYVDGIGNRVKRDGSGDRKLIFSVGRAVQDANGGDYGVIKVTADITSWMEAAIESFPQDSELFIANKDGRIILQSVGHNLVYNTGDTISSIFQGDQDFDFKKVSGLTTFVVNDINIGITTFQIDPLLPDRQYYIGIVSANPSILKTNKTLITWVVVITTLTLAFSIFSSAYVSHPIRKMAEITKKIATGESTVEQLKAMKSSPEVQTLIDAATIMQATLGKKEAEIQESEYRLTLATNAAKMGIWEHRLEEGKQEYWSPQTVSLLGFSEGNQPDNPSLEALIFKDDLDLYTESVSKSLKTGALIACEVRILREGNYVWVAIAGLVERADDGNPTRIVGTILDINDRKKAEAVKSEFVSIISHELRTPMTSIMGALAIVLAESFGTLPEQSKKLLKIAETNCQRLLQLINDILDFEKMKHGKASLSRQRVSINEVMQQAYEQTIHFAAEFNVTLEIIGEFEHLSINADQDKLLQIWTNLISNACKFSGAGTTVQIGCNENDDTLEFFVRDQGKGIPKSFQDSMYTAFSQAEDSGTRKVGGTGLGLSIVDALISLHDGSIRFETGNSGTTFFFSLPTGNGFD